MVGFIHDEFIVEVPLGSDYLREAELVAEIACTAMQKVLPSVPVRAKYTLSTCWSPAAERILSATGHLVPWEPSQAAAQ